MFSGYVMPYVNHFVGELGEGNVSLFLLSCVALLYCLFFLAPGLGCGCSSSRSDSFGFVCFTRTANLLTPGWWKWRTVNGPLQPIHWGCSSPGSKYECVSLVSSILIRAIKTYFLVLFT